MAPHRQKKSALCWIAILALHETKTKKFKKSADIRIIITQDSTAE